MKQLRKSNIPQTPFNRALKYLTYRSRSVSEVRKYLLQKEYSPEDTESTINQLLELKFLNDEDFAQTFTESRQRKGKSKKLISMELHMKGVSKEVAEDTLEYASDDYKTALQYIQKRLHQFDRFEDEERERKIATRLQSRGFNWDIIQRIIKEIKE